MVFPLFGTRDADNDTNAAVVELFKATSARNSVQFSAPYDSADSTEHVDVCCFVLDVKGVFRNTDEYRLPKALDPAAMRLDTSMWHSPSGVILQINSN